MGGELHNNPVTRGSKLKIKVKTPEVIDVEAYDENGKCYYDKHNNDKHVGEVSNYEHAVKNDISNFQLFSESSKCYKAIDMKKYAHMAEKIKFTSRLNICKSTSPQLKIANPAGGRTGTREVAEVVCGRYKYSSVHFGTSCKVPPQTTANAFNTIFRIQFINATKSEDMLDDIRHHMLNWIYRVDFISDDPVSKIFVEWLSVVPTLSTLFTFRDPLSWVRKRVEQHPGVPLCHRSLWDHPSVLHPFDIIGCLQLRENARDAIVTTYEYLLDERFIPNTKMTIKTQDINKNKTQYEIRLKEFENAYIKMNTVNVMAALLSKSDIHPICLWDFNGEASENQIANPMKDFMKRVGEKATQHRQLLTVAHTSTSLDGSIFKQSYSNSFVVSAIVGFNGSNMFLYYCLISCAVILLLLLCVKLFKNKKLV
jgi:hypothetical protein